jgi:hypothetical protein
MRSRHRRRTHRCRRRSFLALRNRLQHIPGTGNVGKINFCLDFFFAAKRARTRLARRGRTFRRGTEIYAYFLRFVLFQRTGVRLLLCHSDQRKRVENSFALDFQLSGKIVDSNLTHPAFSFLRAVIRSSLRPHGVSFFGPTPSNLCQRVMIILWFREWIPLPGRAAPRKAPPALRSRPQRASLLRHCLLRSTQLLHSPPFRQGAPLHPRPPQFPR